MIHAFVIIRKNMIYLCCAYIFLNFDCFIRFYSKLKTSETIKTVENETKRPSQLLYPFKLTVFVISSKFHNNLFNYLT